MKYYFAYGSNMKFERMMGKDRCPNSKPIDKGVLKGYRWVISARGVANVLSSEPDYVEGYVFSITESDEKELDKREGVKKGCYVKEMLPVEINGNSSKCLVYIDPVKDEGKARPNYIPLINKGIIDSKLSLEYVNRYIRNAVPID